MEYYGCIMKAMAYGFGKLCLVVLVAGIILVLLTLSIYLIGTGFSKASKAMFSRRTINSVSDWSDRIFKIFIVTSFIVVGSFLIGELCYELGKDKINCHVPLLEETPIKK